MEKGEFKRRNGTSLHYRIDDKGKRHIDLKREWAIGEERVMRFKDWLLGR